MGCITGAAGGVLRDVFVNEVPLVFRKEIYAMACMIGGVAYYICLKLGFDNVVCGLTCGAVVIITRIVAVRYKLQLPTLKGED